MATSTAKTHCLQRVALIVTTLCMCTMPLHAYSVSDIRNLKADIFDSTRYDKTIRPVNNQSVPVQVTVGVGVTGIISFEMVSGQLEATFYLGMKWTDEFLMWNKTAYGGIHSLEVEPDTIWTPNIKSFFRTSSVISEQLRVYSTGKVVWNLWMYYELFCDIELSMYPFDTQSCELLYFTVSLTSEVMLVSKHSTMFDVPRRENSEWELIDTFVSVVGEGSSGSVLKNTMTLKRLSSFIILHSILPEIALSILKLAVFCLPPESGERVSFSVALILAFTVFLMSLSSEIPHNSRSVSIYSIYLMAENFSASLCVIMSVVSVRMSRLPPVKVPACLRFICAPCRDTGLDTASQVVCEISKEECGVSEEKTPSKHVKHVKVSDILDMCCLCFLIVAYFVTFLAIGIVLQSN